ncbi:hypothetical protein B1F73_15055 [Pseudomonas syringae]|nr:hypothetical protein B1F77_27155 [Pseudomonas syringae]RXT85288.1 hypothetical protein B1F72_13555 [Pseudomonas syringae]RXT99088.1 hypothetical protein B1F73_15055 [Pseudomonas syringae]RXU25992.1 hypothetical protein B0A92_10105 [Pseudomonas syringae]
MCISFLALAAGQLLLRRAFFINRFGGHIGRRPFIEFLPVKTDAALADGEFVHEGPDDQVE